MPMENAVPYVGEDAVAYAADLESRFAALPISAGVLFVGVMPIPVSQGKCTDFAVTLGIVRELETGYGTFLINHLTEKDRALGYGIVPNVFRGVPGTARDWVGL